MTPATVLDERVVWAGTHALWIFLAVLALLLAISAGGWAVWRAGAAHAPAWAGGRSRAAARPPTRGAIVALGIVALGSATLLKLAEGLRLDATLVDLDQRFNAALHATLPAAVVQVFGALTHLGDTATLTVLCVGIALALIAAGRRGLALGWVAAVAGNGLLNCTLKEYFGRVRPLQLAGGVIESGNSFPSGHSSGSLVAYGMLAYLSLRVLPVRWHLPFVLLAVALAWTVGASRSFLGVHFASDVVAGFASGTAWLTACITAMEIALPGKERASKSRAP